MNRKNNNFFSIIKHNLNFRGYKFKYDPIQLFAITFGCFLIAVQFHLFIGPTNIITGGVGGLSLIIKQKIFDVTGKSINASYLYLPGNIILLLVGLFLLGSSFFLKTIYSSIMVPFFTYLLENIFTTDIIKMFYNLSDTTPTLLGDQTSQLIIATVFGSLISGVGLGMVFAYGATTGGSDVLQKIFNRYFKIPYSATIYLTDGVVVLLGMIAFQPKNIIYGVIAILLIGQIVDKVIMMGRRGYTFFIVTDNPKTIKKAIFRKLNRGLTNIKVEGGYTKDNKHMLICTIAKSQVFELSNLVKTVDPSAFSFTVETYKVIGKGFEKGDLSE